MPRQPNLDRSILEVALAALENRRAELDALIGSVKRQLGTATKTEVMSAAESSARQAAPRKGRKRVMSAQARARIAEAQRQRWAASRKETANSAPAKTKPAARKRTMSPEARKRIAEAQKKRWAAARKSA